jgi:hypothetical protein
MMKWVSLGSVSVLAVGSLLLLGVRSRSYYWCDQVGRLEFRDAELSHNSVRLASCQGSVMLSQETFWSAGQEAFDTYKRDFAWLHGRIMLNSYKVREEIAEYLPRPRSPKLGFGWDPGQAFSRTGHRVYASTKITVPHWALVLITGTPPVAWATTRLLRRMRARAREIRRLCPRCGYDLRASPGTCPECGAVPELAPRRAA